MPHPAAVEIPAFNLGAARFSRATMNHTIISLVLIFFQLTTTALVVGFTSREHLFLRAIGSVPQGFSAYHQIVFLCRHISNSVNRAFLGAASVFLVILYIDAAILSRWAFASQSPTSGLGGLTPPTIRDTPKTQSNATTVETSSSFLRKLSFGSSIALQSRFPATPWAVPRLPPFHKADPKHTPTKSAFLLKNTTKCLVYLLLLRATSGLGNPDNNPIVFASDRIPLFSRLGEKGPGGITLSEIGTRVGAVLGYWAIQYAVIDLLYSLLAVVAVSLHLTDVKGWVPVFGSVSDARGVRLFWGYVDFSAFNFRFQCPASPFLCFCFCLLFFFPLSPSPLLSFFSYQGIHADGSNQGDSTTNSFDRAAAALRTTSHTTS